MPEAHAGYAAPTARVPRTIWEHAHEANCAGATAWPPFVYTGYTQLIIAHLPDNWNGFSDFYLKFLGDATEQISVDITIDVATCDELENTHTQTVNNNIIDLVLNEYECFDLMTPFATVIALMESDDDIRISLTGDGEYSARIYGAVIEES